MLQGWDNFATVTGSAAGALTGLLFVAVSLNRDRIVGHAGLRSEAAQTLVLFLVGLLLAVLLVIPGMSARTLGVVLVAVALVSGAAQVILGRAKPRPGPDEPRGRPRSQDEKRARLSYLSAEDQLYRLLDAVSPNLISTLCITIAGCLQLAGGDGLYWLAAAVVLTLGGGVINAWLFLTGDGS